MKYLKILILFFLIFSCDKDNNNVNNNNPYLPNYSFDFTINMNLPQYNNLIYPSNAVFVNTAGVGIKGVIVFNAGNGNYVAFDAACPNQPLQDCSTMTINGVLAKCPCDNAEYSLFTGLAPGKQYPMKMYRIEKLDNVTLRVYN